MKIKLTWRIWLWLAVLLFALISIFITPHFLQKGILITSVEQNSSAFEQGLRQGQIISEIDGKKVENIEDFSKIINEKFPSSENIKTTLIVNEKEYTLYSKNAPEITVSEIQKTNIKTGLDLSGGARALVKAKDEKLTSEQVNDLVSVISNRFNVYGISDINVKPVIDLSGNSFILIEIAGATPKDLQSLISEQGKFEAKIGNETVFIGGERDITSVAKSGQEAGIYSCDQNSQGGWYCNFRFSVYLSEQAATRHAEITKDLSINQTAQGNYLSKTLDLYIDDKLVDSLMIGESLKGVAETKVSISGAGTGTTKADALKDTDSNMKHLQTILITGSLPFKLEIVKLDTISPTLGEKFSKYIFIAAFAALFSVAVIIFIKYRKIKLAIPPLIIATSEIVITLGVAAFMRQDLDLPGIAGILAAIGTGIDDQIVMLDETKRKGETLSIKQRIKRAFGIVLGAYFTSVVSLLPLLWAGAGLLKGFAIMTLIGITFGVLITRPAFADIIRKIEEKDVSA
jgi:preprotein translocase subunit SecD